MTFAASNGASIAQSYAWSRAGPSGPLLLQDFASIDLLAHFDRERIPECVMSALVHAKGAGAHGYFEGCSTTSARHIKFCKGRRSAQWYGSQEQVLLGDGIVCSLKHWVRIDGAKDKAWAMVSRVGGWLY
ncbi:uncharacterized protein ARMOST_13411 [Armillaria ostoyae]|uniref:Catalase core domain-containing protein n=1 Tax=Armillaria ostoyae TaxID=47428 RepID=A0A284RMN9_ARMOS|nr:uncharacterized protein ARMOST_13411 [Armillaria ostoyae]